MIAIAGRQIDASLPPYLVAELSSSHGGDLQKALDMIAAAAASGADAVKIQLYEPDDLAKRGTDAWNRYNQWKTPVSWLETLFAAAAQHKVTMFASVFSLMGLSILRQMNCPAYKIASPEIVYQLLIEEAIATSMPVIVSTGMARLSDAIDVVDCGVSILLHCVSKYPCPVRESNLRAMETLRLTTGALVGLSDHTAGIETAIAATALGAVMIEKHFKIDNDCVDEAYSLNPDQFADMREAVDAIHAGMGTGVIMPTCEPRQR